MLVAPYLLALNHHAAVVVARDKELTSEVFLRLSEHCDLAIDAVTARSTLDAARSMAAWHTLR